MLEWKSGPNVDVDQLKRYERVTADDLIQRAFVPAAWARLYDTGVIGRDEHEERLVIGVDGAGTAFPVLLATSSGLRLCKNRFSVDALSEVFDPELAIDWDRVPTSFVPVDADSDLWELAEVVIPQVITHMAGRSPEVGVDQLCGEICPLTWSAMGPPGKNAVRAKLREVLQEAAASEFDRFLDWRSGGQGIVVINENPFVLDARRRTQAFRRMGSIQAAFIERLKRGQLRLEV